MKTLLLVAAVLLATSARAQAPSSHLDDFEPFVGKTWRGTFASAPGETPAVDISRWEWALNGQAIRVLHSVNEGEYGGETIIMWDAEEEALIAHYFTTAGFMTRARIEPTADGFFSHEEVRGHSGGITVVEARATLHEDGRMTSSSRYLRNGEWEDGHSITYVEAPGAEVVFRNPH